VVSYTPGTGLAAWQPTAPAFAPVLLPQWPGVAPFAMSSGDQLLPPPPPAINSFPFTAAFEQVKQLGSASSATHTAHQTQIAIFWADGAGTATPPGHWNQTAQDVAQSRRTTRSLAETARLFALLNAGHGAGNSNHCSPPRVPAAPIKSPFARASLVLSGMTDHFAAQCR